MDIFADKVFINHEIDYNPKPEDAGRIKVYVSIMSEDLIIDCPTVLNLSLPAKDILDSFTRYRWEQLNCLKRNERLNPFHVSLGIQKLNNLVVGLIFSSVTYHPNRAFLCYLTFDTFTPPSFEEYAIRYEMRSLERDWFMQDDMQVPFDERTIDNRLRPASKVAVESLPRKVYKKTTSSTCAICFDEFKMGERVVTLPCGHEFDDSCILEWFAKNHVCPLCRFKLPCEN